MGEGGGGGGTGSVPENSVFPTRISVELAGNFAIRTLQPSITGMKAG